MYITIILLVILLTFLFCYILRRSCCFLTSLVWFVSHLEVSVYFKGQIQESFVSKLWFRNDYVHKTFNDVYKEEYCGCLKCHCDFFHNGRKDLWWLCLYTRTHCWGGIPMGRRERSPCGQRFHRIFMDGLQQRQPKILSKFDLLNWIIENVCYVYQIVS